MSFKIGKIVIKNPLILAPMAGVTDTPYKILCKEYNTFLVCSEMISSKALLHNNQKTLKMINILTKEKPVSLQIFGNDATEMGEAAKIIESKTNVDIIDINFGCPAPKITKSGSGGKLLKDPQKIFEIVKSVVDSVDIPVTAKIRIGYDKVNALEVAKLIEKAGAKALTIHGRLVTQGYKGEANWEVIKEVKSKIKIPVIGNGDIKTVEDCVEKKEYANVDGIMIGRSAIGNPFIFKKYYHFIENKKKYKVDAKIRYNTIKRHYQLLIEHYNERMAILKMRKHLPHYLKNVKRNKDKVKIMNSTNISKILLDIKEILELKGE